MLPKGNRLFPGVLRISLALNLIPETDAKGSSGVDKTLVQRHRSQLSDGFGKGHAFDEFPVVSDHPAIAPFRDQVDRLGPEQSAEHTIHVGGASAALQM